MQQSRFPEFPAPSSPHLGIRGLEDNRYVVERFQAMADGDIRRMAGAEPAATKGSRKVRRTVATLKAAFPIPRPFEVT